MVEGNDNYKLYRNLASYSIGSSAAAGAFVINTNQPWNNACMFRVKIEGYFYDSSAPFEVTIGAYMYVSNNFVNYGYINVGSKKLNVRLGRNPSGKIAIILGSEGSSYSYPKLTVIEFIQGHSNINESYADGWTISQLTSLSGYSYLHTVPDVTSVPVSPGSNDYIQNQSAVDQAANFRITGNGYLGGNVGIGTTTVPHKLTVNGTISTYNKQLIQARYNTTDSYAGSLWWNQLTLGNNGANYIVAGRQTAGGYLQFVVNNTSTTQGSPSGTTAMTIISAGNVGIGTTSPGSKLTVAGVIQSTNNGSMWAKGGDDAALYDVNIANTLGVYGQQNSAVGSIKLGSGGGIISGYNGNVGIGTSSPGYKLDLANGTFAFGNSNQRTESRDNAGLQGNAGAQSGFFETASPTNYPAGAGGWWHLLDVRHSNMGNNYAMQLAGSFFDQKLYFRKTNGSATTAWNEVTTSVTETYTAVSLNTNITIPNTWFTDITGMTLTFTAKKSTALVLLTTSGHGYTNSMSLVNLRIWNNTTGTSIGGCSNKIQAYDDLHGTVTVWSSNFSKVVTGLTAGNTYSIKVQGSVSAIFGTDDAVIYPSTYPDSEHMTLTVFY